MVAAEACDEDVAFVNRCLQEHNGGALWCERAEGKGRLMRAARSFEPGDIILEEDPLRVVHEQPGNPAWDRVQAFCRSSDFDLPALWYWCALTSLTSGELGSGHATSATAGDRNEGDGSIGWEPLDSAAQRKLLLLHQGDVEGPSKTASALAAVFTPGLQDVTQLERCLQAWSLNAFVVLDPRHGHATFFVASMFNHSCLPSAVWHYGPDNRFVLVARRRIAAGDEVTISYLDESELLDHARLRRNDLSRFKKFWCTCDRCVEGDDLGRGMRCGNCKDGIIFAKLPSASDGSGCAGVVAANGETSETYEAQSVLRPIRPAVYDENCAADVENWLTMGAPPLARRTGRFYYEVRLGNCVKEMQLGWATDQFEEALDWTGEGVGDDEHSWAADGDRGRLWHGGDFEEIEWSKGQWSEGDVIGCAADLDAGVMTFSENGVWAPEARMSFSLEGRALYPAISLQGNFAMAFTSKEFAYEPPDPSFKPLLRDGDVLQPLDRRAPLRCDFAGTACGSCGSKVGILESARLTQLEQELQRRMEGWGEEEIPLEEAVATEELLNRHFAQHSLANRARERLAKVFGARRKRDRQIQLLRQCRAFSTAAYSAEARTAALAWAQDALADALMEAATTELRRARGFLQAAGDGGREAAAPMFDDSAAWLREAVEELEAAHETLVMMFSGDHEWSQEVAGKIAHARKLLSELAK